MLKLNYPWLKTNDTHSVECCLCEALILPAKRLDSALIIRFLKLRDVPKMISFFLSPQPGIKYVESLYNHPTYFQGTDDMYGLAVNDKKSVKIAEVRVNEIFQYINKARARSVLEIGCGHGYFLEASLKHGFVEADGLEFSKEAVEVCQKKKLNVFCADVQSLFQKNFLNKIYDVVAGYSVLEHLENPVSFLRTIKSFLAPQGILVIRVPNTDSDEGPRLCLVDHLWHFTKNSLSKVLKSEGFKIKDAFESGIFKGLIHGGEMKSVTVVAVLK